MVTKLKYIYNRCYTYIFIYYLYIYKRHVDNHIKDIMGNNS